MISRNRKNAVIRKINIFKCGMREEGGKPIDVFGVPFEVPPFPAIRDMALSQIEDQGFTTIKRVKPDNANCIIRVCQHLHHVDDDDTELVYNLYGVWCYTKDILNCWQTFNSYNEELVGIDFSKNVIRHWKCQDEYVLCDCEFVDYYYKIS